jgi:hypothetical protein
MRHFEKANVIDEELKDLKLRFELLGKCSSCIMGAAIPTHSNFVKQREIARLTMRHLNGQSEETKKN